MKKFPRCLPTTKNWGADQKFCPYLSRKSSYKISAHLVEEWLSYDTFCGLLGRVGRVGRVGSAESDGLDKWKIGLAQPSAKASVGL